MEAEIINLFNETYFQEDLLSPCSKNHYTGKLLMELGEDDRTSYICNGNNNGKNFEYIFQLFMEKKYKFKIIDDRHDRYSMPEIDIFKDCVFIERILRKNVPMSTLDNILNANIGRKTTSRKSKTEFVLEIWDARPTEEFPKSVFNNDGSLKIRIECKTQSVSGTTDKKIDGCINDLKHGSPEKNIIFLMTGSYFEDYHYERARYCFDDIYSKRCPFPEKNGHVMNENNFYEWCKRSLS